MTTASLIQPLAFREVDNNGAPLAFGTVMSYQAGTVIPIATYTDSTAGTPNANPVVLNSRGEAQIWVLPNMNYKFVVKDSVGNQIRVTDNVQQSQLITLYGGVDSGITNAYILNFTASFSSYTDGIVLYWIPSNSNTEGSTVNVNSLGVTNILNGDGSALRNGQLVANQVAVMMMNGGNFILINTPYTSASVLPVNIQNTNYTFVYTDAGKLVIKTDAAQYTWTIPKGIFSVGTVIDIAHNASGAGALITINAAAGVNFFTPFAFSSGFIGIGPGSTCRIKQISTDLWVTDSDTDIGQFLATWNGFSVPPAASTAINYRRSGALVTLVFPQSIGTSNATTFSCSGLPVNLRPNLSQSVPLVFVEDNSAVLTTPGLASVTSGSGNIVFYKDTSAVTLWTASGSKGISAQTSFTYSLI